VTAEERGRNIMGVENTSGWPRAHAKDVLMLHASTSAVEQESGEYEARATLA
jgi:hypothetical protein